MWWNANGLLYFKKKVLEAQKSLKMIFNIKNGQMMSQDASDFTGTDEPRS